MKVFKMCCFNFFDKNRFQNTFILFFSLCVLLVQSSYASEISVNPEDRYAIERSSEGLIVYYLSHPENGSYPICIVCDGSESKGNERSVIVVRDFFEKQIRSLSMGCLAVEKWGIDGSEIDQATLWQHYTRSARLQDHLEVIDHLQKHPPSGWNGQLIFIGVSEGGALVTDLSILCPNTIATINWSGAGDWSWADELWHFFEHWKQTSFWIRLYDAIPRWLPFSSDIPPTRSEFDTLVQEIIAHPQSDRWMGGMTYLYHADAFQKPPIDYTKIKTPFLVVAGTEDSTVASSDQFVQKGLEAGAPITYFRVDGMDHYIRKRPDIIDCSFEWLHKQLVTWEKSQPFKCGCSID